MKIRNIACIVFMLTVAWANAGKNELYVAPGGSDKNPGSKEKPFKTITHARDVIRRVSKRMNGDVHVYLRGGNYPIERTIEFTPADSGMNGFRIIYQAYENEEPVLNGAVKVTGWTKHTDTIYKASLNRSTKLRTLIVNGKRAYMARETVSGQGNWGSYKVKAGQADWARVSGSSADGVKYKASEVPLLSNAGDVEIMRNTVWNSNIVCVREIVTEGEHRILKLQQPYGAIALRQNWGAGFKTKGEQSIHNAFEFLDEPGEFYFNKTTKTLYYYANGEDMATAEVYAPQNGSLISIDGVSREERVKNISFKGLTFANTEAELPQVAGSFGKTTVQAATWCTAFDEGNWHKTKYRAYDTMQNAVQVSSAQSILFENNTFKHIGNEGIGFINDVSNSGLVGNYYSDIGGSAIQVGHPQHLYEGDGDESEHEKYSPAEEGVCKNILIKNNVMYGMTKMYYGHAGITAYFVDSLTIINNHLQDMNYSAVSLGWGWYEFDEVFFPDNPTTTCKNNKFNNNRVYDCMQMLHDGGAFYTIGSQPNSEASGNYVNALTTHFQGVYHPDQGTAWYTGKDLVFEITPGQDNFELNEFKRKHDNHYSNIYSTSSRQEEGAPNSTITDLHVFPKANWPQEALDIIKKAGPEPQYHHLLEKIPGIEFESSKRYAIQRP